MKLKIVILILATLAPAWPLITISPQGKSKDERPDKTGIMQRRKEGSESQAPRTEVFTNSGSLGTERAGFGPYLAVSR